MRLFLCSVTHITIYISYGKTELSSCLALVGGARFVMAFQALQVRQFKMVYSGPMLPEAMSLTNDRRLRI